MGWFSRKNKIPDIGKEEETLEEEKQEMEEIEEEAPKKKRSKVKKLSRKELRKLKKEERIISKKSKSLGEAGIQFEKVQAKLNAIEEFTKSFSERFSNINQQIGEVRSANLGNEKALAKISAEAAKAVDVVKEVKPRDLRVDYQKANVKLEALDEKIRSNKELVDSTMNELNEFRRKSKIFIGTEGLLKLNEDVKKDLLSVQKLVSKVKFHADKAENVFLEVRKGFAESQKVNALVENLDKTYSGLKEQMDKLKVNASQLSSRKELEEVRGDFDEKIKDAEFATKGFEKMKDENSRIAELVEKLLIVSERNRREIHEIESSPKRSDKKEVESLLKVVELLTEQVNMLKKKIGMHAEHVSLPKIKEEKPRRGLFGFRRREHEEEKEKEYQEEREMIRKVKKKTVTQKRVPSKSKSGGKKKSIKKKISKKKPVKKKVKKKAVNKKLINKKVKKKIVKKKSAKKKTVKKKPVKKKLVKKKISKKKDVKKKTKKKK